MIKFKKEMEEDIEEDEAVSIFIELLWNCH